MTTESIAALPSVTPDALYTPAVLGQLITRHEESVRRDIREGRIQAVHIGRNVRVRGTVILQILSQGLPSGKACR
jgi:hypothetical protein